MLAAISISFDEVKPFNKRKTDELEIEASSGADRPIIIQYPSGPLTHKPRFCQLTRVPTKYRNMLPAIEFIICNPKLHLHEIEIEMISTE